MGMREMLQMLLARAGKTERARIFKSEGKTENNKKGKNAFVCSIFFIARTQATFATFSRTLPVASRLGGSRR